MEEAYTEPIHSVPGHLYLLHEFPHQRYRSDGTSGEKLEDFIGLPKQAIASGLDSLPSGVSMSFSWQSVPQKMPLPIARVFGH